MTAANLKENVRLRRKCLKLISRIATEGATSPNGDISRCALRLLTYGIARYNYNNPYMGQSRANKELRDLEQMHWELKSIDPARAKKEGGPHREGKMSAALRAGEARQRASNGVDQENGGKR